MAINDVYRVAIEAEIAGQKLVNVLHYRQNSISLVEIGAEFVLTCVEEELIPAYALLVSASVSFRRITAVQVAELGETAERGIDVPGGISGETYALQVSPLLSWKTGMAGRSNRGRTYLFPPGEGQIGAGGVIAAINRPDYLALANQMKSIGTTLQPGAFSLGIYSKKESVWNVVTSVVLRDYAATQRSRRPIQ